VGGGDGRLKVTRGGGGGWKLADDGIKLLRGDNIGVNKEFKFLQLTISKPEKRWIDVYERS
jgi:hypothetical protein